MKTLFVLLLTFYVSKAGHTYNKYGRTCKDIECGTNEECVMAQTPCSVYTRNYQCGSYPTCQRVSVSKSAPSCDTCKCPPTKKCIEDRGGPRCVYDYDAHARGNVGSGHPGNYLDSGGDAGSAYPGNNSYVDTWRRPGSGNRPGSGSGNKPVPIFPPGSGNPGNSSGDYKDGASGSRHSGLIGGYQGGFGGCGYLKQNIDYYPQGRNCFNQPMYTI